MSQVLNIFTVDYLQMNETAWTVNDHPFLSSLSSIRPSEIPPSQTYNPSNTAYWRPSNKLRKVLRLLYEEDYAQFPCVPCSYCSRLLYPQSAKWIVKDNDITSPAQTYLQINLTTNPRNPTKIAICDGCKSNFNNRTYLSLAPIPQCIHDVPYSKRKYLSPIYLHTSLGRSTGANPFVEYRSLVGQMGYSKNRRTFSLYSGMIGAFLQHADLSSPNNRWYHPSLRYACDWLQQNNPYLSAYHSIASNLLTNNSQISPTIWPQATHISENELISSVHPSDIIMPSFVLPDEIHNEDAHYSRLAIGFFQDENERQIPLRFTDPELEAILFPDLFPDGHGFYSDICNRSNSNNNKTMTYGKYIKSRLMGYDPRFRLHPMWMMWSYMQLEKIRNFQNTARVYRQRHADATYSSPSATQWLRKSHYTNEMIVDEEKSMPLPTFIRTGDSYFKEKEHHLNTMVKAKGLPTLFITLSMAETKWSHLTEILRNTDNGDTNPTNRPFHVCMHFIQRYRSLKKRLWNNKHLSGWKSTREFFERVEFQNRGAAHLHIVLWTEATIEEMIASDEIRSTIPDPENEPELYAKVRVHQIHTCRPHLCGGPPIGEQCKRHFPRPFAPVTQHDPTSFRYIYKAITEEDRWVVPYHAPTLIAWDAHSNMQYVTDKGFARYMTKYISKAEPSHVFNIRENNRYYQHVLGRRLGAMETIFLITGETICNSSATVNFLPTDPPKFRSKTILPVANLLENPDNPYYIDSIEKYFRRPYGEEFNNLTYEQYYQLYEIRTPNNTVTSRATRDLDNRIIIKRKKPILTRTRFIKLSDGEPFFYYRLLQTNSWRSEDELSGPFPYYRDRYFSMYPNEAHTIREETRSHISQLTTHLEHQFASIIDSHLQYLQQQIVLTNVDVIQFQLNMLKRLPHIAPSIAGTDLPQDQYSAITILSNMMGSRTNQWPYYFLTGSAGTGKSFIIHQFRIHLQQKRKKYIVLAPTGVAAQNVDGMTIHSALKISSTTMNTQSSYQTLIFNNTSLLTEMRSIQTLIIDEISMVSASLLTFISDIFAKLHNNHRPFGGINVLVAGDLCQLPPVRGTPVFHSSVWQLFYPLFLRKSQRQLNDNQYFNLLEEVRLGRISDISWQMLEEKYSQHSNTLHSFNTTSIVGYKQSAERLNVSLCNLLQVSSEDDILISTAVDKVNREIWNANHSQRMFKQHTNLPLSLRLQPGARVMYLNNDMINQGICNGTIGIVTKVIQEIDQIHVSFLGNRSLIHAIVYPKTSYFSINGIHASRKQFPLQNCFALTVHKSQGLTLPHISLYLDNQFFAAGQAYTALSRAPSWNVVEILSLDKQAFAVDQSVIREYERLENKAITHPLIF